MYQIIKFFSTGGILPGDSSGSDKSPNEKAKEDLEEKSPAKKEEDDESVIDKIKDALQDWSNDNERDIQEDDNSALRSGL